jgi:hypothetical protein
MGVEPLALLGIERQLVNRRSRLALSEQRQAQPAQQSNATQQWQHIGMNDLCVNGTKL